MNGLPGISVLVLMLLAAFIAGYRGLVCSIARRPALSGRKPLLPLRAGAARPRGDAGVFGFSARAAAMALVMLVTVSVSWAATPAGTDIDNQAIATYDVPGIGATSTLSNIATFTTVSGGTVASITLMQHAPLDPGAAAYLINTGNYRDGSAGGPFLPILVPPIEAGSLTPIDLSATVPLTPVNYIHVGDPLFIVIDDMDQNADPAQTDTVTVIITVSPSGETEEIELYETEPDSGVFTGYIETTSGGASQWDSVLHLLPGDTIDVTYTDSVDSSVSIATLVADPVGRVFDSLTGNILNGVLVTIIDEGTGLPAIVNGDDGFSSFPSTVATGGTYTDSSSMTYNFAPGTFRFPFLQPGTYRIEVTPPAGYTFPSVTADASIQLLPGSPYVIGPGSRRLPFTLTSGHGILIDVPLDPASGALYVNKKVNRDNAAVGDHLLYSITVDEASSNVIYGAMVYDKLPRGFIYMEGSSLINGVAAPDPAISADRKTLTYSLGDMPPGTSATISYVVQVAAGARPGRAVNAAYAQGSLGPPSNVAEAPVWVREDLMRSKATIMGRVVADACGMDPDATGEGVKGVRIYMEDGTYVVTDENGMFHLKGIKPGGHVVQLDYETLPPQYQPVLCNDSTEHAGSDFSRFVDLAGGTLWRTDFHLGLRPRTKGELKVEFNSHINNGSVIDYELPLIIGNVPVENVRVTLMLPDEVMYKKGSATVSGIPAGKPDNIDGSLTFRLGDLAANTQTVLEFNAITQEQGVKGKFVARAIVTFDTVVGKNMRTPVLDNVLVRDIDETHQTTSFVLSAQFEPLSAELTEEDKLNLDKLVENLKGLEIEHLFAFGHTDSLPLSKRARVLYKDNYELSTKRARSVVDYMGTRLDIDRHRMSFVGHGPDNPVADNATEKGRMKNRRVEIKVFYDKVDKNYELSIEQGKSSAADVETQGVRGRGRSARKFSIEPGPADEPMPEFDHLWMDTASKGLEWVWPAGDYHPDIPLATMAIKHGVGSEIDISRNGQPVGKVYFEFTKVDDDRTKAVTVYKAVPLEPGDNMFLIREMSAGQEVNRTTRNVHFSTRPVKARFLPGKSMLIADGKTNPVVAVRLTDKDGHPARKGMMGEFSVRAPHRPMKREEGAMDSMLDGRMRYSIGRDGVAYINLAPTTHTGEAELTVHLEGGNSVVSAWLEHDLRDWILVGFAEGTAGYNSLSGNLESLSEDGHEGGAYTDGRIAFFAKGRVKGKWLITAAYDSAKPGYDERSLHSLIDPDEYYTLYGDGTTQANEAPSRRKLYLKIERGRFYALFGDYETGLTVTSLSRYTRSFNGFKSAYSGDTFRYKVFATDTSQAFVKDELPGDGTSGLYRLTRKNIVLNSEKVSIQVRDRFRPDVLLESRPLTRHIDYDIDYLEGTIFFREPVSSTVDGFNPVYIVADYESYDNTDTSYNYGGRAAVSIGKDTLEVGGTYIHEEAIAREANLMGADATLNIGSHTRVKGEVATTEKVLPGTVQEGYAYLLEVQNNGKKHKATAYIREQDENFGIGQQSAAGSGIRRAGVNASYDVSRKFNLSASAYREFNFVTQAERDYGEFNARADSGNFTYGAGLTSVVDRAPDGTEARSDLVKASLKWRTLKNRLTLSIAREQALDEQNINREFPTRTVYGADYRVSSHASLFAAHEVSEGEGAEYEISRAGIKSSPWNGGTLNSSLERQFNENGSRVYSNFGLMQRWQVSRAWALSAGFDRRDTLYDTGSSLSNTITGEASEDFTAASLGATYAREKLSWRNRVEYRAAESYDKAGLFTAVNGEFKRGVGMSAGLSAFRTDWNCGAQRVDMNVRLGVVRRPFDARWIILDRLDYYFEEDSGRTLDYETWRVVNNFNANFKPGKQYQVSMQYGSKYVKDHIEGMDYKGYTDLIGLEARFNINKRWDIGPRYSVLHSWEPGIYDHLAGFSVGYSFARNIWMSLGYNFDGYQDRDFSAANYTAKGVYLRFRLKFDQMSVKKAVRYFTGG